MTWDDLVWLGWLHVICNNPLRLTNKWLQWPLTWDSSWECWDDSQWLGIHWGWLNMPWDSLGMSWDDLGWLRYHLVSVGITHMTDKQLENPALKIILLNKQNQHINPAHKRESTVTDILNTGFRIVYSDIGISDNVISNNLWYKVRVDSGNWWTDQHDSMTPLHKNSWLASKTGHWPKDPRKRICRYGWNNVEFVEERSRTIRTHWTFKLINEIEKWTQNEKGCACDTNWWRTDGKNQKKEPGRMVKLYYYSESITVMLPLLLAIPMCGCLWSAWCSDWSTLVKNTWQLSVRTKVWNKSSL